MIPTFQSQSKHCGREAGARHAVVNTTHGIVVLWSIFVGCLGRYLARRAIGAMGKLGGKIMGVDNLGVV